MIIEFKTVRANVKEIFEKERTEELGGTKEFYNTEDYTTSIFIEMDDVLDFTCGRIYKNQERLDCIFIRMSDSEMSPNVIIKGEDFKRILESVRNCKIKTAEEILNTIRNESNSTGI